MKTVRFLIFLLVLANSSAFAQSTTGGLVADQNPNYLQSQNKYMMLKDSLIASENTTIQQTYKAYDWYQARLDNRNARRENRRAVRLARANNMGGFYDYYPYGNNFSPFNNNFYSPFMPSVGYRSGNWRFWY